MPASPGWSTSGSGPPGGGPTGRSTAGPPTGCPARAQPLYRHLTLAEVNKGDIAEPNAAVYLSETLELNDKLKVNAALRFDQFMFCYRNQLANDIASGRQVANRSKVSPKMNVFYTYSPVFQLYNSAGLGFHSNDIRVSVLAETEEILPTAYGIDVGAVFKPLPNLLLQAAAWRLDLDQELVYVGTRASWSRPGKPEGTA